MRIRARRDATGANKLGHLIEALRMAGRENHHRLGIFAQHALKHAEQRKLLAFDRAAANQHGKGLGLIEPRSELLFEGDLLRGLNIEFQVTADRGPLWRRADLNQPPGIFLALCQKKIYVLQYFAQHWVPPPVSAMGAVRDAGIHNGQLCAGTFYQAQKIRPEFGFCQHHQFGAQTLEVRPDGKGKVEGKIKDVLFAVALAREFLSGGGGGGKKNPGARVGSAQLCQQLS